MNWLKLYESVFSILKIEKDNNRASIIGSGFVINNNPIYLLTCNHVVSEGSENNDGKIIYSITKRSGKSLNEFDIRKGQISYLGAKKIFHKPEYDLAILEIEQTEKNKKVFKELNLDTTKPLKPTFKNKARKISAPVQWLSTGVFSDQTLTPRFFQGTVVTEYIANKKYNFINQQGQIQEQTMEGVNFLEIDQLFLKGCSGGPVVNSKNGRVIGYIHGFKVWPIMTNAAIKQNIEITENSKTHKAKIKLNVPLIASLSLAVDLRSVKDFLLKKGYIHENLFDKIL